MQSHHKPSPLRIGDRPVRVPALESLELEDLLPAGVIAALRRGADVPLHLAGSTL
jgi:hypothetical protein